MEVGTEHTNRNSELGGVQAFVNAIDLFLDDHLEHDKESMCICKRRPLYSENGRSANFGQLEHHSFEMHNQAPETATAKKRVLFVSKYYHICP